MTYKTRSLLSLTAFTLSLLFSSSVAIAADQQQDHQSRSRKRSIRIAAVSVEQIHTDITGNLNRIEAWAHKAAAADAELVLFPELSITGWWQNRKIRNYAEPLDGPSITRLIKLADELDIAMAVGITEKAGDKAYITHVVLDGDGIIQTHRKSSLAGGENGEARFWDEGNDTNVFTYKNITFGIAICFESVFPETCRNLTAKGAEIILAPYANGTNPNELLNIEQGRAKGKRTYTYARAKENNVWYVACDDAPHISKGEEGTGAAYIIDPKGQLVTISDTSKPGETMVVHTIELPAEPISKPHSTAPSPAPPITSAQSPLDGLAAFKDYSAARVSSYDRDGYNADFLSDVAPGETAVLADLEGPGMISHIWITIDAEDYQGRTILLRVFWDGEKDPSILCPINDFFCSGHGLNSNVRSLPITCTSNGRARNSFFKMPFNRSARIEIENQGLERIGKFYYYIDYRRYDQPFENAGYFHARYRQEYPTIKGQHYKVCDLKGRGHYVGTTLSVESNQDGWWGEGDDRIFIDGQSEPAFHGTGTEDYLNDAWGIWPGSSPYYGCTVHESRGYKAGARYTSYRFHIEDPIPFTKSLYFEIEDIGAVKNDQGHWVSGDAERTDNWSSVAYWYQQEPHKPWGKIAPVDQRLPDEASEKAHILGFLRRARDGSDDTTIEQLREDYDSLMNQKKYASHQSLLMLRMAVAEQREGDKARAQELLHELTVPFLPRQLSKDSLATLEDLSSNMPPDKVLLVSARDGSTMRVKKDGRWAIQTQRDKVKPHIYFALPPEHDLRNADKSVQVVIDYWTDGKDGREFTLQYDSFFSNDIRGWYHAAPPVVCSSTPGWHTVTVTCPRARLAGHQNERADFRLWASGQRDIIIGDVRIALLK